MKYTVSMTNLNEANMQPDVQLYIVHIALICSKAEAAPRMKISLQIPSAAPLVSVRMRHQLQTPDGTTLLLRLARRSAWNALPLQVLPQRDFRLHSPWYAFLLLVLWRLSLEYCRRSHASVLGMRTCILVPSNMKDGFLGMSMMATEKNVLFQELSLTFFWATQ